MLGVVGPVITCTKYEKPMALWAFFPLALFGPDSGHKNVLESVFGSAELVGSLDIKVEGGAVQDAVYKGCSAKC